MSTRFSCKRILHCLALMSLAGLFALGTACVPANNDPWYDGPPPPRHDNRPPPPPRHQAPPPSHKPAPAPSARPAPHKPAPQAVKPAPRPHKPASHGSRPAPRDNNKPGPDHRGGGPRN
ncbi:hypothetical protein [uncultured Desulfovibrio sp.]|uniref:hypothetical protein n=1 Tax=uncultured Desulfovibrio sp. TaxID=167968 RepID=UPI002613018F|nr:hypothetical protein [uncultured Desulfovibrio sp.]